jgi:hypothetical protein
MPKGNRKMTPNKNQSSYLYCLGSGTLIPTLPLESRSRQAILHFHMAEIIDNISLNEAVPKSLSQPAYWPPQSL